MPSTWADAAIDVITSRKNSEQALRLFADYFYKIEIIYSKLPSPPSGAYHPSNCEQLHLIGRLECTFARSTSAHAYDGALSISRTVRLKAPLCVADLLVERASNRSPDIEPPGMARRSLYVSKWAPRAFCSYCFSSSITGSSFKAAQKPIMIEPIRTINGATKIRKSFIDFPPIFACLSHNPYQTGIISPTDTGKG